MEFKELSDEQWKFIRSRLPLQPIIERKRADDRNANIGAFFVYGGYRQ